MRIAQQKRDWTVHEWLEAHKRAEEWPRSRKQADDVNVREVNVVPVNGLYAVAHPERARRFCLVKGAIRRAEERVYKAAEVPGLEWSGVG